MAKKKELAEEQAETTETNVPAVRASAEVSTQVSNAELDEWGMPVSAKDIIIPNIYLMQPMSEKVTAGEAAFGDFRESLSNEKLGDFKQGFDVVPLMLEKLWVEFDDSDDLDEKEYLRTTPVTPQNESLPYEDQEKDPETGKMRKIARDLVFRFYVLLLKDLEMGTALPHIISFRRTSLRAGKQLATQMYVKNRAAHKIPPATIVRISASTQTQDKKTWAVMNVTPVGPTPATYLKKYADESTKELGPCFYWLDLIKSGQAKAHQEEHVVEDAPVEVEAEAVEVPTGPARF